jgi:hypothetical protein
MPLAKFKKVECEGRQGLQQAQLFADHFATPSHNHSQVHFLSRPPCPAKALLSPYPGLFCGKLLCYDDFIAQPCL